MKAKIGKRLLTVRELARYLGISERTIYNKCSRSAINPFPIKPIRIGSSIRFDIRDIIEFVECLKSEPSEVDNDEIKN
jgi:excisionase family DNA binding protein